MCKMSLYPFGRMNIKAAMLVPILLLSMFDMVPLVTTQIAPSIAKISPTLLNEMANAGESVNVLIKTFTNDYSSVIRQINDLGGKVGYLFKYLSGLSASLPTSKIADLAQNSQVERIYYDIERRLSTNVGASLMGAKGTDIDELLSVPITVESEEYETISITPEQLASLEPSTYWNPTAMGATPVWEEGYHGQGSLVAIIDTGIWANHFLFAGTSIIGGVDLSYDVGTEYEGWNRTSNHWHGSHVAGIIASTGGIIVPPTHRLAVAIERYTGTTLPTLPDGRKIIWLLGMAPLADLYIVKVFDHTGRGVPESMVIAAIEHVIDLKVVEGYDVDVISMSLGGPTLYDGRDPMDQEVDYATSMGITVIVME